MILPILRGHALSCVPQKKMQCLSDSYMPVLPLGVVQIKYIYDQLAIVSNNTGEKISHVPESRLIIDLITPRNIA